MYIAQNFTNDNWKALDLLKEDDWQKAIDVLKDRLFSRYIEPVDALIEMEKSLDPKSKRFGFTTLAIDLLLMETIQAFKEGLADTKGKSRRVFKSFLESSTRFSLYFTDDSEREEFYQQFRCGILHQAEVQGSPLVWAVGDLYDRSSTPHTMNRNFFHTELKKDLDDYLEELRNPSNSDLREKFKNKMEAIVSRAEEL